jgi:hypothetical protein
MKRVVGLLVGISVTPILSFNVTEQTEEIRPSGRVICTETYDAFRLDVKSLNVRKYIFEKVKELLPQLAVRSQKACEVAYQGWLTRAVKYLWSIEVFKEGRSFIMPLGPGGSSLEVIYRVLEHDRPCPVDDATFLCVLAGVLELHNNKQLCFSTKSLKIVIETAGSRGNVIIPSRNS